MPPNNHAARLREMVDDLACFGLDVAGASALLAGAEALEACEKLRAFADELAAQNMPVLHGMAYQLDRLLPQKEKSDG
jgi:hypothetical protein